MMYDTILNMIQTALKRYSFDGDRTLEYIGITVEKNSPIVCKIYRANKNHFSIENTNLPSVIKEFHKRKISQYTSLRFLDCSVRKNSLDEMNYSLSYNVCGNDEVKKEFLSSFHFGDISRTIQSVFSIDGNPFFQIAYLLDEYGNELEKKFYYTLNVLSGKFVKANEKKQYIIDNYKRIESFCSNLFLEENRPVICNILQQSLTRGYRPFLLGFNVKENYIENKLYFINDEFSWDNLVSSATLFLKSVNLYEKILSIIQFCYKKNLFIKGYAVSFYQNQIRWRFYLQAKNY